MTGFKSKTVAASVIADGVLDVLGTKFVRERTCVREIRPLEDGYAHDWFACSSCGKGMTMFDRYCPKCGAKVIG